MSGPRLTEQQKQAILRDHAAGMPLKQIAYTHGVDQSYPTLLARRRGLTSRSDQLRTGLKDSRRA